MSRTNLGADTLARMLRRMAGDGSVKWIHEPIQASVLLDIADMLDENAKLHEQVSMWRACREDEAKRCDRADAEVERMSAENAKLRELIADVHESLKADKAGMFHNLTLSAMEDDMCELGIEVDE